jgi:energy-coupling factor transporter ATP-binding protein EcfA2
MTRSPQYERPYHWWGPGPAPPTSPTPGELLNNGTLDLEIAAKLWAALGQHRSLTIIGGPSGLGKSTLLQALLPSLPQNTRRVYLRGCYETFSFLHDDRFSPANTTLLVNEISPHLPIYLWGPAVARTLTAAEAGYQVLATAHGRSVTEFLASLAGSPLRIPARNLAHLGLVALLEPTGDAAGRRLTELWQLSATRDGVSLDLVGQGDLPTGVTPALLDDARTAVKSLLVSDAAPLEARTVATPATAMHDPLSGRTAADLEQTPAGE